MTQVNPAGKVLINITQLSYRQMTSNVNTQDQLLHRETQSQQWSRGPSAHESHAIASQGSVHGCVHKRSGAVQPIIRVLSRTRK